MGKKKPKKYRKLKSPIAMTKLLLKQLRLQPTIRGRFEGWKLIDKNNSEEGFVYIEDKTWHVTLCKICREIRYGHVQNHRRCDRCVINRRSREKW